MQSELVLQQVKQKNWRAPACFVPLTTRCSLGMLPQKTFPPVKPPPGQRHLQTSDLDGGTPLGVVSPPLHQPQKLHSAASLSSLWCLEERQNPGLRDNMNSHTRERKHLRYGQSSKNHVFLVIDSVARGGLRDFLGNQVLYARTA